MLLEEARAFERRYTEVLYLRGLAYLTIRESAAAATEFRKIIDHKGATWAALRAGPAWSTAAQAGDSARAKQAYSDFFTLGKTPTRTFQFCWKPGRNTRRLKFSSEV
jgi:hypothetical protein